MRKEINNELKEFIKRIKKNNSSIEKEEIELGPDEILFEFFDEYHQQYHSEHSYIKSVYVNNLSYISNEEQYYDMITLLETKDGNYAYFVDGDNENGFAFNVVEKIQLEHLKFLLKKHPKIYSASKEKINNNDTIEDINTVCADILTIKDSIKGLSNKAVCKSLYENVDLVHTFLGMDEDETVQNWIDKPANIIEFIKKYNKEELSDFAAYFNEIKSVNKLSSILRTKENKNELSQLNKLLKEVVRLKISPEEFKNSFSTKVKKYKTTDELKEALKKYINQIGGWNLNAWKNKASKVGAKIEETENNKLRIETESFEQMKELGSTQWCIATDKYHFDDYTSSFKRQYMVCDFNKEIEDPMSMIGITVDTDGSVYAAHNKNDNDIKKLVNEKFDKYSEKEFEENIIKKRNYNSCSNIDSMRDFRLYTYHSMTNNKDYLDIENKIKKAFENHIKQYIKENRPSEINKFFGKLIVGADIQARNNIKEVMIFFNKHFKDLKKELKFNNYDKNRFIKHDKSLLFLDLLLKNDDLPNNICDSLDLYDGTHSFNILKKVMKYNKKLIIDEFKDNVEYGEKYRSGYVLFSSKESINYIKESEDLLKDGFRLVLKTDFSDNDDLVMNNFITNMVNEFGKLSNEDKSELVFDTLKNNISSIDDMVWLVEKSVLDENIIYENIKKLAEQNMVNDTFIKIEYNPKESMYSNKVFNKSFKILKNKYKDFYKDRCFVEIDKKLNNKRKKINPKP